MTSSVPRVLIGLLILSSSLPAISLRRRVPHFHHQAQAIGTRNRVHVNRLITEPGTLELEIGAGFSEYMDNTNPALLKYTPITGRTEFSVGFDYAHSSNDVTLAANSLLYDGEHWNVSLGPSLTIVQQGGRGLRAGATAVTRYDHGPASIGLTATWSKATRPNDNIPADITAFGLGGGVRLGKTGWRSHLTANGNVLVEKDSATPKIISTFEGLEWEITGRISANAVVQQLDWRGPNRDNQFFLGLTVNFGRLKLH